jgi:hypothetical protein
MVMAFHMAKAFLPSSCLVLAYLASYLVFEALKASYLGVTSLASYLGVTYLASYQASYLRVTFLASYQAFTFASMETFVEPYQTFQVISHIHRSYS